MHTSSRVYFPLHRASSLDSPAKYSDDEMAVINELQAMDGDLKQNLIQALPSLPPTLIMKIRQETANSDSPVGIIAGMLQDVVEERLKAAKETLQSLLQAGEVRKLDSLIGKAAKNGDLDAAFFQVMNVNMNDAAADQSDSDEEASRYQILQHIYTRCQEELEKNISPGLGLLNKLLRTDQESIRANIYEHYLTPPKTTIQSPDGKSIELPPSAPLVSITEFVKAVETSVVKVRTLEKAGGTDAAMAASMVESCRDIAKEARIVIGRSFGKDSPQVLELENGLQPVFRPNSPESPYIQGEMAQQKDGE